MSQQPMLQQRIRQHIPRIRQGMKSMQRSKELRTRQQKLIEVKLYLHTEPTSMEYLQKWQAIAYAGTNPKY